MIISPWPSNVFKYCLIEHKFSIVKFEEEKFMTKFSLIKQIIHIITWCLSILLKDFPFAVAVIYPFDTEHAMEMDQKL